MIAIIIAPPRYILAVRRKETGEFWFPMWSDAAQAQQALERLGAEWIMVICQDPNPAVICTLMASMVGLPIRGYVLNPGPTETRIPVLRSSIQ